MKNAEVEKLFTINEFQKDLKNYKKEKKIIEARTVSMFSLDPKL